MKYNIFNSIVSWSIKKRIEQINDFMGKPVETQYEVLRKLIQNAKDTKWGKNIIMKK